MSNNNTLVLDFEKNIVEIEAKIESLKLLAKDQDVDIAQEVNRLEQKLEKQVKLTYANLTPWQKLQVSRHPQRPHCLDYVHALIEDFTPLCGDRLFGDDEAMIGGIGRFKNISVVVIGQEKGSDLETRMKHNFGMAKPEGYRKSWYHGAYRESRLSHSSIPTALSRASTPKPAVRPRQLLHQLKNACRFMCRLSQSLLVWAVPAVPLPLPRLTGF